MAYKLIGEDMAIGLLVGTTFDGSIDPGATVVTTGVVSVKGIAKSVSIKGSIEKTNVKSLGDYGKKNRYHSEEATLEIDQFVPSDGYNVAQSALGKYITVTHDPLSSLASPFAAVGVVTSWDYSGSVGTEQMVKLTIDLNPDYTTL